MPSVDSPSVLYAHYGFRSGPRRFGTRPFNFMLAATVYMKLFVLILAFFILIYFSIVVYRIKSEGDLIRVKFASASPSKTDVKFESIKIVTLNKLFVVYKFIGEVYIGEQSVLIDWFGLGKTIIFPEVR